MKHTTTGLLLAPRPGAVKGSHDVRLGPRYRQRLRRPDCPRRRNDMRTGLKT
jgi:hypothetical protein